jgi:hypothetical protein
MKLAHASWKHPSPILMDNFFSMAKGKIWVNIETSVSWMNTRKIKPMAETGSLAWHG